MADPVELAFHRAATRLIGEDRSVLAAVSGGADSIALLHLLWGYAQGRRLRIAVAHLDHGLRRGSGADRRFVERVCRRLAVPCLAERVELRALRRREESPEEAARRVRRAFLLRALRQARADLIATGHTLDDQAETVLLRLVRGAGPTALCGMTAEGPGPFVRPLLGLEKQDLLDYLRRRGIPFREDPSNRHLGFDRNRVRLLLVPQLQQLNPRASRQLVRAAERLRDDAEYLDALAARRYRRLARATARGLVLSPRALATAPTTLATRIARLALREAGMDARRITSRHLEALVELARGPSRKALSLPGGLRATRPDRETLLLRHHGRSAADPG